VADLSVASLMTIGRIAEEARSSTPSKAVDGFGGVPFGCVLIDSDTAYQRSSCGQLSQRPAPQSATAKTFLDVQQDLGGVQPPIGQYVTLAQNGQAQVPQIEPPSLGRG